MNWNRKLYFQGQLIYRMTNTSKIFYSLFYDNKDYQDYDRMYKYNPDGMVQKNLTGLTHILKYQRQLNTRTFFTIAGSFYERKYTGRLSPDK